MFLGHAVHAHMHIHADLLANKYREVSNDDCSEQKTAIFPGFTFIAGAFVHDIGYGRLDLNSHRYDRRYSGDVRAMGNNDPGGARLRCISGSTR